MTGLTSQAALATLERQNPPLVSFPAHFSGDRGLIVSPQQTPGSQLGDPFEDFGMEAGRAGGAPAPSSFCPPRERKLFEGQCAQNICGREEKELCWAARRGGWGESLGGLSRKGGVGTNWKALQLKNQEEPFVTNRLLKASAALLSNQPS